jgi:hypothetical protein
MSLHEAVDLTPEGVLVEHVLTGERRMLEADSVVAACGRHANDAIAREVAERVPEVHVIGDAWAPRGVHQALLQATRIARDI